MNQPSPEIVHLCKIDPVMKRVIGEVGPYALSLRARRSPFESLARAIAYQQLHDKAAESILKRFIALFPGRRFPPSGRLCWRWRRRLFAAQGFLAREDCRIAGSGGQGDGWNRADHGRHSTARG
jgi:hypothetical protein